MFSKLMMNLEYILQLKISILEFLFTVNACLLITTWNIENGCTSNPN